MRRKIAEPGSPFRYLRKAALYLANGPASVRRAWLGSSIARDLPPALQPKLEALRETGFAEAEESSNPLIEELERFCAEKLARGRDLTSGMINHWARFTEPADRDQDGILVRLALQDSVLALACSYFGQVPYLADVDIVVSIGTGKAQWGTSQLWHCDYADHRTLKYWIYLSDVAEHDDGPFTYIPKGPSRNVPNTFFPGRVSDETISASVSPGDIKEVYGKSRRSFYIDTSVSYHCGSRLAAGRRRIAYVATFLTKHSLYPMDNGIAKTGSLPVLQRLVLGFKD